MILMSAAEKQSSKIFLMVQVRADGRFQLGSPPPSHMPMDQGASITVAILLYPKAPFQI